LSHLSLLRHYERHYACGAQKNLIPAGKRARASVQGVGANSPFTSFRTP
jgi:hypothetical protein